MSFKMLSERLLLPFFFNFFVASVTSFVEMGKSNSFIRSLDLSVSKRLSNFSLSTHVRSIKQLVILVILFYLLPIPPWKLEPLNEGKIITISVKSGMTNLYWIWKTMGKSNSFIRSLDLSISKRLSNFSISTVFSVDRVFNYLK
jgi:protein-S-isoprenylcysteine O-methyltransferase Ste14